MSGFDEQGYKMSFSTGGLFRNENLEVSETSMHFSVERLF